MNPPTGLMLGKSKSGLDRQPNTFYCPSYKHRVIKAGAFYRENWIRVEKGGEASWRARVWSLVCRGICN
jgi:hypothetical protein